ncbi:hypothetical protein [Comamonas sp.]|uniref:hypothetical protein n=1 Tax=Comamonas sp. TaxID=34028 RepID=UPI00258E25BB|nr:hypothetical protein [Comamonas sp.]
MPKLDRITLVIETLPSARAQVQVNIPTPMPGMRLETAAHALAIDALGWLGKQSAVAGFVYGEQPTTGAMTGQQRINAIRRHHIRAGEIVDLACATATMRGEGDDQVCDLLDSLRRVGCLMHPSVQPLHRAISLMDGEYPEDNNECLNALQEEGLLGYAICFHAPADNTSDDPIFDNFYTTWIYAETIDAAWQHAMAWGNEVLARKSMEAKAA